MRALRSVLSRYPRLGRIAPTLVVFCAIAAASSWGRIQAGRAWVNVRWSAGVAAEEQTRLERSFFLGEGKPHADDERTWRYVIEDASSANLRAIVEHPAVEDTQNILRDRFELEHLPEPLFTHVSRALPGSAALALLFAALWHGRPASGRIARNQSGGRGLWPPEAWHRLAAAYLIVLLGALSIGVSYHYLTNDHAGYLAMARQVMFGEWPIRDFLDHGTFLHILISAFLQWAFGHRMLAEMVFCNIAIAAGYWVTLHLTSSAARNYTVGFLLTLSCILTVPRPYAYPKILIYPVAIYVLWRYVRERSNRNLALLGLLAALAFQIRIDHGVAVLAAAGALIAFVQMFTSVRASVRHVGLLLLWFLGGLAPFLVYLTMTKGIVHHFVSVVEFGQRALAQSDSFRVHVLGLDTSATAFQRGAAMLHDGYALLTVAAVIVLAFPLVLAVRRRQVPSRATLELLCVLVVWMAAGPMLVRDIFVARFPDVAPILAILGAGLIAAGREVLIGAAPAGTLGESSPTRALAARGLAAAVVVLLLVPAGMLHGGPSGVVAVYERAVQDSEAVYEDFVASPPDAVLGSHRQLVKYARDCTTPSDRLLVTWFAPEVYFGANRRFAGNQWVYVDYQNSPAQQRQVMRAIDRQSVPLVFARPGDAMFAGYWPVLADYIFGAYEYVGPFDGALVYARRGRRRFPRSAFGELPCFAPTTPEEPTAP